MHFLVLVYLVECLFTRSCRNVSLGTIWNDAFHFGLLISRKHNWIRIIERIFLFFLSYRKTAWMAFESIISIFRRIKMMFNQSLIKSWHWFQIQWLLRLFRNLSMGQSTVEVLLSWHHIRVHEAFLSRAYFIISVDGYQHLILMPIKTFDIIIKVLQWAAGIVLRFFRAFHTFILIKSLRL